MTQAEIEPVRFACPSVGRCQGCTRRHPDGPAAAIRRTIGGIVARRRRRLLLRRAVGKLSDWQLRDIGVEPRPPGRMPPPMYMPPF